MLDNKIYKATRELGFIKGGNNFYESMVLLETGDSETFIKLHPDTCFLLTHMLKKYKQCENYKQWLKRITKFNNLILELIFPFCKPDFGFLCSVIPFIRVMKIHGFGDVPGIMNKFCFGIPFHVFRDAAPVVAIKVVWRENDQIYQTHQNGKIPLSVYCISGCTVKRNIPYYEIEEHQDVLHHTFSSDKSIEALNYAIEEVVHTRITTEVAFNKRIIKTNFITNKQWLTVQSLYVFCKRKHNQKYKNLHYDKKIVASEHFQVLVTEVEGIYNYMMKDNVYYIRKEEELVFKEIVCDIPEVAKVIEKIPDPIQYVEKVEKLGVDTPYGFLLDRKNKDINWDEVENWQKHIRQNSFAKGLVVEKQWFENFKKLQDDWETKKYLLNDYMFTLIPDGFKVFLEQFADKIYVEKQWSFKPSYEEELEKLNNTQMEALIKQRESVSKSKAKKLAHDFRNMIKQKRASANIKTFVPSPQTYTYVTKEITTYKKVVKKKLVKRELSQKRIESNLSHRDIEFVPHVLEENWHVTLRNILLKLRFKLSKHRNSQYYVTLTSLLAQHRATSKKLRYLIKKKEMHTKAYATKLKNKRDVEFDILKFYKKFDQEIYGTRKLSSDEPDFTVYDFEEINKFKFFLLLGNVAWSRFGKGRTGKIKIAGGNHKRLLCHLNIVHFAI